jgi:kynureninase
MPISPCQHFPAAYRPGAGIERMRVGTPPVLQLAALEAALDVWDHVDLKDLRAASLRLQDLFIKRVETQIPGLTLATPRAHLMRGSQVSFRHPEGYAIMQALIAEGVIGDFRSPDILRFGFTPLYIDEDDVARAVNIWARIMELGTWDKPAFKTRARVT